MKPIYNPEEIAFNKQMKKMKKPVINIHIHSLIEKLEVSNTTKPNDTQNKERFLFHELGLEKVISEALREGVLLPDEKHQKKSRDLATILRQECTPLDRLAQSLLKKEKVNPHLRKIGRESPESCLLYQTASLLHIVFAYVIPHLEQLSGNKNQSS